MDTTPVDRDTHEQQPDAAAAAQEQPPVLRGPTTFRAVEKLNPDLEPFIFFGF